MNHYAIIDTTVSINNPGSGFANAKKAIAFSSKALRDKFLADREHWDLTSKKITRKQAMKMLVIVDPNTKDKGLPLDQEDFFENCIVLKESNY